MKRNIVFLLVLFFPAFLFGQAIENAMVILPGGNVGVGTERPTEKLEVNGNIKSNERIMDKTGFVMPVGTILPYGGIDAPAGWLLCDGKALKRTDYPDLYDAIKTNFGNGSTDNSGIPPAGQGDFNLPDLRGQFLRGVDNPRGQTATAAKADPDAASRITNNSGGNGGDKVGSKQGDAFQGHEHRIMSNQGVYAANGQWIFINPQNSDRAINYNNSQVYNDVNFAARDIFTNKTQGDPRTASETRTKNVYVNYIIKY